MTAKGKDIDSQVDPRFGRSEYFIIMDTGTLEFESIRNPYAKIRIDAGVASGKLMAEKEVRVVLTGSVGDKALRTLQEAGVEVIPVGPVTVKEAIEKYQMGDFRAIPLQHVRKRVAIVTRDDKVFVLKGMHNAFTIIDIEDDKILGRQFIEVDGSPARIPKLLREKGVHCVVAERIGPYLMRAFRKFGIKTVIVKEEEIDQIIEEIADDLSRGAEPLCDFAPEERKPNRKGLLSE